MKAKNYHPFLYWSVILSTSTAGTTMSDFIDRTLAIGYEKGALILASLLIAILALWRWQTGSLSVTNVILFWAAFVLTRPLGATVGPSLVLLLKLSPRQASAFSPL